MKIGFTGTQRGLTWPQQALIRAWLEPRRNKITEFHHGDCIGADALAHDIVKYLGIAVHIHPPIIDAKRAFKEGDHAYAPKEYLARNRDIVDMTDGLFACPGETIEQQRSGTWSTIRYARRVGKHVRVLWPEGGSSLFKAATSPSAAFARSCRAYR